MFYRPLFTSGTSCADNTLVSNTAAGMTYYFDGITARLMQQVLETPRETLIDTKAMSEKLQMSVEKIEQFMQSELLPEGLVADHVFTDDEWKQYHTEHAFSKNKYGKNDLAVEAEYESHIPADKHEVTDVMLELTYACSERCIHCYNDGAARSDLKEDKRLKPGQLGLNEYRDIIDKMIEEGVRKVTVSGGDPFSHPECWEILDYLSEKNLFVTFQTNALALNTPEKINRLVHLGITAFAVTIYSADPAVHDSITRREGSFNRTLSVMKEMAKWPIQLEVKCPVFNINANTYYGVHRISDQLDAGENFSAQLVQGMDGDNSVVEYLNMNEDELRVVMQDSQLKMGYKPDKEYTAPEIDGQFGTNCSAMSSLTIGPTGNVACCAIISGSLGNIKRESLHDIIHGEARRQALKRPRRELFPNCGKEPYCKYCLSICMAGDRHRTDGTPYNVSETFCTAARIRMEIDLAKKAGKAPLEGEELEKALQALPKHEVPVFKKHIL